MELIGICLITKDVLALTKFYCDVLNTSYEGDSYHTNIKLEGAGISIFSIDGMEKMAPNSMQGAGSGNIAIEIRVKNVDAEYERLKGLGIEFVKLPETYPWGSRSFWFKDPDGNIIDFLSMVSCN